MGVKLGDEDREPGPITTLDLIRNFDGYPDPTESKADAHVVGIKQALKYDNVTLKTHSTVERLETDGRGRNVTGVVVKNGDGSEVVYSTDWVIVAAGAINSAALFLRSKNDSHPNGLANSSGLVGRNYVEAHDRLTAKLKSLLSYIGCHERLIPVDYYLGTQFPFNLAHQMGTMKLGTDPRRSVLDTYCRPHDLENVFVSDGSFFVSSGAVNPTLTIIAQTLRVADFIKRQVL
ncbi:MAG TPA: GMC oxidoreductase [Anaerolineae bacterium]